MLAKRQAKYCHICRDEGDLDAKCVMCRLYFHSYCFQETFGPELLTNEPFVCQPCYLERGDTNCAVCHNDCSEARSRIKCEGCPVAVHKWCIRKSDSAWKCDRCINAQKMTAKRPSRVIGRVIKKATGSETTKLVHQPFCEVCQKGQRLLFCDKCPKSFHASCIEHVVNLREVGDSELWKCPLCDGLELYGDSGQGTTSIDELKRRMACRNARNKARIRRTLERRNAFISAPERYPLIRPFVCEDVRRKLERHHWNQQNTSAPMFGDVVCFKTSSGTVQGIVVGEENNGHPILSIAWREGCMRVPVEHVRFAPQHSVPVGVNYLATTQNGTDFLAEDIRLKEYQVQAVDWLLNSFSNVGGAILADDMGLGKTLEALSVCGYLQLRGISGPHLVVVPTTCLGNWQRECRRFCPQLKTTKIAGSRSEREWALSNQDVLYGERDVYITTYETLTSCEDFFASHIWQTLILDEAHRVKDQDGRVRKTLSHIGCNFRLLLTGTPLQNNVKELFTLLNYLWPDVLRNSIMFENAISINTSGSDVENISTDAALVPKIQQLLQQLMLRRTKAEVLQLPPKTIRDVWLPMSPFTVQFYRALHRVREERKLVGNGKVRQMLALVMKMRILACHPRSLVERPAVLGDISSLPCMKDIVQKTRDLTPQEHLQSSSKLVFLDKLLFQLQHENMADANWKKNYKGWKKPADAPETIDGYFSKEMVDVVTDTKRPHKVLLFSQFQLCLDQLQQYCEWRKWKFLRLDGSTHRVIRELDTKDFNNEDSDHIIYLISTRAGGLGINLHSANFVVLYDQDWNPHIDTQAMDRAHRIGQERRVTVYRLTHEWTVEERLKFRQQQKREMDELIVQSTKQDESLQVDEKLTPAEISTLLKHGEGVIKTYDGEDTSSWSIQQFVQRVHNPLPESTEEVEEGGEVYSTLEAMAALDKEDAPVVAPDLAEGRRSTRIRKATVQWEPEDFRRAKVVKKALMHDETCFCCKKPAAAPSVDSTSGGSSGSSSGLLCCERCPKAYHPECQGFNVAPRNKFTCSWHDCLACRRNGSDVGGLLVQCIGCPKSYCPDCFPPTFRRVYPPESFFAQLQKQGWEQAIKKKMVNFQCNDCRVAEEERARKSLAHLELMRRKEQQQMVEERMRLRDKKDSEKIARKNELEEARRKEREVNESAREDERRRVERIKRLHKREKEIAAVLREKILCLYPPIFRRMWGVYQLNEEDTLAASRDELRRTLYHDGLDITGSIDVLRQRVLSINRSKAKLRKTLGPTLTCGNCSLPGHTKDACIFPDERKKKEGAETNVMVCAKCEKANHSRVQCRTLQEHDVVVYEARYSKMEKLCEMLADAGVSDDESFFEHCIWYTVDAVTTLVQEVLFKLMQELGLIDPVKDIEVISVDTQDERQLKRRSTDTTDGPSAKRPRQYTDEDAAVAMERLRYQVAELGSQLAPGWKCEVAASRTFLKFLSPAGDRFASVKKAVEFIGEHGLQNGRGKKGKH